MNDSYHKQIDPRGRPIYWLDGAMPEQGTCPDSDLEAIIERYVAITPLKFDVTDREMLAKVTEWEWPTSFD